MHPEESTARRSLALLEEPVVHETERELRERLCLSDNMERGEMARILKRGLQSLERHVDFIRRHRQDDDLQARLSACRQAHVLRIAQELGDVNEGVLTLMTVHVADMTDLEPEPGEAERSLTHLPEYMNVVGLTPDWSYAPGS